MSDGSEWVQIARDTMTEERSIPLQLQSRLRNAFTVELINSGINVEPLHEDPKEGKISITFPTRDDGKPCMRIQLHDSTNNPHSSESRAFGQFIANKTENPNADYSQTKFLEMRESGSVRVSNAGGYHGRNDTTIIANSVSDLKAAVAGMITNPLIRRELERDVPSMKRE